MRHVTAPPATRALSQAELGALHAVQLGMLLEIDAACRQLGIRYQLAAGTLLGAVRHGGFIPWDDDLDIAMLRPDYERFVAEAPRLLGGRYVLQTCHSDPAFAALFAKLWRTDSAFPEIGAFGSLGRCGVFVDIFPFDNVGPGLGWGQRWGQVWGRVHLRAMLALKRAAALARHAQRGRVRADRPAWQRWLGPLVWPVLACLPDRVWLVLQDRVARMFRRATDGPVACLVQLPLDRRKAERLVRPRAEFAVLSALRFEGHLFPVPQDWDKTLTRLYGDYRQWPRMEDRQPSHPLSAFRLPDTPKGG